jgi:hypothetical protein
MNGETNLDILLKTIAPELSNEDYIFCSPGNELVNQTQPFGIIREEEGVTAIITRTEADRLGLKYEAIFEKITLKVHSSLNAIGLTAKVTTKLAEMNICANVISGYYHDHIFVQKGCGAAAVSGLKELSADIKSYTEPPK